MANKHSFILVMLLVLILFCSCQPLSQTTKPTPKAQETLEISSTPTFVTVTPSFASIPTPEILSYKNFEDLYEKILSFPAGKTGFPYQGGDVADMEISGPNAFAIFSDGRYVIADLIDNRLWIFNSDGEQIKIIDLSALDILNVSDLHVYKDEIYVLEIYLDPPIHYRINRLSPDGKRMMYYDIPEGYRLENGLTGFMIDCDGKLLLELMGHLQALPMANENQTASSDSTHYQCNHLSYYVQDIQPGENPKLIAGPFTMSTTLTFGLGGISLLKVLPDGSFFVVRSDVVNDKVIQVDDTVHYISAQGIQLGVARVPVSERYYYVKRNLAVGPDGNVYCLLPEPDSINILRLKFYSSLDPLVPGAEPPTVTQIHP